MPTIKKRKEKKRATARSFLHNVGEATVPPFPVLRVAVLSKMALLYLDGMVKDNGGAPQRLGFRDGLSGDHEVDYGPSGKQAVHLVFINQHRARLGEKTYDKGNL